MKKYIATLMLENQLQEIEFSTDMQPVEYLWQHYGISTYIEKFEEVK